MFEVATVSTLYTCAPSNTQLSHCFRSMMFRRKTTTQIYPATLEQARVP